MPSPSRRVAALLAAVLPVALAGCQLTPADTVVGQMRSDNLSRHVDPRFPDHPVVVDEEFGLQTSRMLFDDSVSAVVSAADPASQLRAASIAVFAHSPMIVYDRSRHADIVGELDRLRVQRVLLVGDVGIAESTGTPTVFQDPGGTEALGKLTAHRFDERVLPPGADLAREVSQLDGETPVVLSLAPSPAVEDSDVPGLPLQTRRDGMNPPVTVATSDTPVASVANARAYGAEVRFLDTPDPRGSEASLEAMAGLHDQPLLALGGRFGTDEELASAIREAERQVG